MKKENNIYITIIVIFVSFAWIGYAYVMGVKANQMLLHPIVPILLIAMLAKLSVDKPTKFVINIVLVFIGIWLFIRLQNVFMPFIIGFALAYIVNVIFDSLKVIPLPKGRYIQLPKWGAVLLLLFIVAGVVAFVTFGIVPQIVQQISDIQNSIIGLYEKISNYAIKISNDMSNGDYPFKHDLPESWQEPVGEYIDKIVLNIQQKLPSIAESISQIIGFIGGKLSSGIVKTFGKISTTFFIIIVFVYAIQSFRSQIKKTLGIFPSAQREKLSLYLHEIDNDMRAFLKGQILVILIISVISVIVYSIIGVPFALLVGFLAGLFNAIPTVGPVIGGGIAVLATFLGFATSDYGLVRSLIQILLVIGAAFGIQILDNSLISPRIMSKAIDVNPLIIMFAVLLSATLAGILGALLTIPAVIVVKGIINVQRQLKGEKKELL